jgi:hypothetical protein
MHFGWHSARPNRRHAVHGLAAHWLEEPGSTHGGAGQLRWAGWPGLVGKAAWSTTERWGVSSEEFGWSKSHRERARMVAADWRCAPAVMAWTRHRGAKRSRSTVRCKCGRGRQWWPRLVAWLGDYVASRHSCTCAWGTALTGGGPWRRSDASQRGKE